MVARRRDGSEAEADPVSGPRRQLRRRFEVDLELDVARASRAAAPTEREPGFVEDEPEDGVPTPRPRMPMSSIPVRLVDGAALCTLPLDHRAGFVLSHIDGTTDIHTLVDVCGMTQDEVVELVERLLALRVIRLT